MSLRQFSILVADDTPDIVSSVVEQLTRLSKKFKHSVRVYTASSATDVFSVLNSKEVDCLLLDYHFEGGMSGDEIMDAIVDPFGQKLIFLMSARPPSELEHMVVRRHKRLGDRFRFLRKPFEPLELQEVYLQIVDFLCSRSYPCPLAYTYQVMKGATTAQARLTGLKDLVESIIIYSVAVLTADCKRLGTLSALKPKLSGTAPMTLGAWLKWLAAAIGCIANQSRKPFMPELLRVFSETDGVDALRLLYEFKDQVRDNELGHGFVREEDWYSRTLDSYSKPIEVLFDCLLFTTRYPLVAVETIDLPQLQTIFRYTVRSLMGSSAPFPVHVVDTPERLTKDAVFAFAPSGIFLSLHPVLRFCMCDKCSIRRLFSLERVSESTFKYRAHCNHQLGYQKDGREDEWFKDLPAALFSAL
jgi:CheY-like chemotaxis protein